MTTTKYLAALQELSYQDLMFLLSLAKTQNIAQTANVLQFSNSSASRRLAVLRRIFHDELFVRSGQVMVPTPRMLELIHPMEHLLEQASTLFERSTLDIGQSERSLRLAVSDHLFHSPFTRTILKRFFMTAPNAVFSMTPADNRLFDRLRENMIDIAFYLGNDMHKEEFHSVDLYRGRYGIFVRSDHPLVAMAGARRTVSKDQIAQFRSIRYNYIDGPASEEEEKMRLAVGDHALQHLDSGHCGRDELHVYRSADYVKPLPSYDGVAGSLPHFESCGRLWLLRAETHLASSQPQ